jgi:hypothetical protein
MEPKNSGTGIETLRNAQELFYDLVTAPAGVASGLIVRGLGAPDLEVVIRGDKRLSAVERLDIYANMYFYRILDVLREEYPRVVAVVGDVAFHDLVTDYLLVHRPRNPSLREAGAHLSAYLARHALGIAKPWLVDLAHLERTHRELFDGVDAVPLTLHGLQRLAPDVFATMAVRFCPTHTVFDSAFALSKIWSPCLSEPVEPEVRRELLLVWRQNFEVIHRVIDDAGESAMLALASRGATMGELCEVITSPIEPDTGNPALRAFQILARWVADGLLTSAADRREGVST